MLHSFADIDFACDTPVIHDLPVRRRAPTVRRIVEPPQPLPTLSAIPSTLLIPLAARAHGSRLFPHLPCHDRQAAGLLKRLGADAEDYLDDQPTVLNVLWRTQRIVRAAKAFFRLYPNAWGINLGCGLSHYFQWLDSGRNTWVDADLPEVMALRRRLLPEHGARQRRAVIDLQSPQWWQALNLPEQAFEQPLFVLCEGVLMYLAPEEVHAVLQQFSERAPSGSRLLIDTLSHCSVGIAHLHPSVARTGAQFRWGIANLRELTDSHAQLKLLQSCSVSECYGWMGMALEAMWQPWVGAPLYGLAELGVRHPCPLGTKR